MVRERPSERFSDGLFLVLETERGAMITCLIGGGNGFLRRVGAVANAGISAGSKTACVAVPTPDAQWSRSGIYARRTPATKNVGHECPTYGKRYRALLERREAV